MSEKILNQILVEIKDIKSDVSTLKTDVSSLKEDVSILKTDVSSLKEDVSILKIDVSNLKEDISTLKVEQEKTTTHLARMDERFSNLEVKQDSIYKQTGKLTEYHAETMSHFVKLVTKEDLEYFDKKISEHEREIFKIKNA